MNTLPTAYNKVCPTCRRQVPLAQQQCPGCGHAFRTQFGQDGRPIGQTPSAPPPNGAPTATQPIPGVKERPAVRVGQIGSTVSRSGIATYHVEIYHDGLGKARTLKGSSPAVVQQLAKQQAVEWERAWNEHQERDARAAKAAQDRDAKAAATAAAQRSRDEKQQSALKRTSEASQSLEALQGILHAALARQHQIVWASMATRQAFTDPQPSPPALKYTDPPRPNSPSFPREPQRADPQYQPVLSTVDQLIPGRRARREAEAESLYLQHHEQWRSACTRLSEAANRAVSDWERAVKSARAQHEAAKQVAQQRHQRDLSQWQAREAEHRAAQARRNEEVADLRRRYQSKETSAVETYCRLVLERSPYPSCFPRTWRLSYSPEAAMLVVDYDLPAPDALPTLVEVRYVASKDELAEKHLTAAQAERQYDDVLYQTALRTIHELFAADSGVRAIEIVAFNGVVTSLDRATGKRAAACVLSLCVRREDFASLDLANVDPKACFRQLRGVGSSKLHSVTPVAPVVPLPTADRRFVDARAVVDGIADGDNLAAMGWEDFEHLIREVFEMEFSVSGGEVRVTQASRDGGVDAIAFDPDPIRGGKIVIQAKRYTNTVGVSAVRDLYGTVMSEGATKGILVTTSDYGPDAYAFVKGKPLTLLNGANLLHLLEKHGHRARIDLGEARLSTPQGGRVQK